MKFISQNQSLVSTKYIFLEVGSDSEYEPEPIGLAEALAAERDAMTGELDALGADTDLVLAVATAVDNGGGLTGRQAELLNVVTTFQDRMTAEGISLNTEVRAEVMALTTGVYEDHAEALQVKGELPTMILADLSNPLSEIAMRLVEEASAARVAAENKFFQAEADAAAAEAALTDTLETDLTALLDTNPRWADIASNPEAVQQIAITMTELGLYTGPISGEFNEDLRLAVEAFQMGPDGVAAGLNPDGIPGRSTLPVMLASLEAQRAEIAEREAVLTASLTGMDQAQADGMDLSRQRAAAAAAAAELLAARIAESEGAPDYVPADEARAEAIGALRAPIDARIAGIDTEFWQTSRVSENVIRTTQAAIDARLASMPDSIAVSDTGDQYRAVVMAGLEDAITPHEADGVDGADIDEIVQAIATIPNFEDYLVEADQIPTDGIVYLVENMPSEVVAIRRHVTAAIDAGDTEALTTIIAALEDHPSSGKNLLARQVASALEPTAPDVQLADGTVLDNVVPTSVETTARIRRGSEITNISDGTIYSTGDGLNLRSADNPNRVLTQVYTGDVITPDVGENGNLTRVTGADLGLSGGMERMLFVRVLVNGAPAVVSSTYLEQRPDA